MVIDLVVAQDDIFYYIINYMLNKTGEWNVNSNLTVKC